jgi:hypothetical protein
MSVREYEIKHLKNSNHGTPIAPVPLATLRPVAQRGYYTVIVLSLLFNTIQQVTEPTRTKTFKVTPGQTTAVQMRQTALRSPDSIESSNRGFKNAEMVLMDLPVENSNTFSNRDKWGNQGLKRKHNESIENQKGERHVNDQSEQI